MDNRSIATISLEDGEILKKMKVTESKPSYQKIGNNKMNHKIGLKSIDLLEEVGKMNSDEKFCFFEIKNRIHFDSYEGDFEYTVKIRTSNYTSGQKSMFSRGYKKLREKDIVRRIKRGLYMINPLALVPNKFEKEYKRYCEAK